MACNIKSWHGIVQRLTAQSEDDYNAGHTVGGLHINTTRLFIITHIAIAVCGVRLHVMRRLSFSLLCAFNWNGYLVVSTRPTGDLCVTFVCVCVCDARFVD